MGLDLQAVHLYEKIPGTDQTRLVRMNPYARITRKDHPPIYVQAGQVYGEGGGPVEPLPAWFDEEIARLSPKVREEIGWRLPEPKSAPVVKPAPPVTMWTCPAEGCGETLPTRKKGLHISAHRKRERAKGA